MKVEYRIDTKLGQVTVTEEMKGSGHTYFPTMALAVLSQARAVKKAYDELYDQENPADEAAEGEGESLDGEAESVGEEDLVPADPKADSEED